MIDMITPFVRDMEARALPPYQNFLKSQKAFIIERSRRIHESEGHESPGIRLLRYILQFVDHEYLNSQANNYDRYLYHLRYIRRDIMNIFDRVSRGRGYTRLFFAKSDFLTEEFLIPIEDVNTITNLPLHTEDWNEWKKVRPLRLWAHDSNEFTINTLNDRVTFKSIPPSYAIELLDVVALTFKYYIWNKYQKDKEPQEELVKHIPTQLFLHKYVMDGITWDLANIWLLSSLSRIAYTEERTDMNQFDASFMQVDSQYGRIAINAQRGFESIWDLLYDTKRNLRPEAFFSSKILYGGSINDRIELTDRTLTLPGGRNYEYLRWMRDKDLVAFFLGVWKRRKDMPAAKTLFVNFERDYQRMLKRRPWNACQNTMLKNTLESEMEKFIYQALP